MNNAKLTALTVDKLKSFSEETRVEFAPLTIIVGRNNSGKSTLIQSLLLLKQTLSDPRSDVMLSLEGTVDAFSLRELTFGWPPASENVFGPTISVEWESDVDVQQALLVGLSPDLENLAKQSGIPWLKSPDNKCTMRTALTIKTSEVQGVTKVHQIQLRSLGQDGASIDLRLTDDVWTCYWGDEEARKIGVDLDHFIPYLRINRNSVGPRDRQRAWHNAYLIFFAQPLESLKKLLSELHYLGSLRQPPPSLFKAATTAPNEIGVSGEFAAQLLHRRQRDIVHFLPLSQIVGDSVEEKDFVQALPLVEAVNRVMNDLSVEAPLRVEEIQEIGFRLMFGDASLVHVGRGLSYLLPLVELGLFADPLRFKPDTGAMRLDEYRDACNAYTHIALEEPEAHLHPKVASRLAHWLVSLARANRRLLVETHSDHLVRRLRGLAARAGRDSTLERWLVENVVILSVEQVDGKSNISSSRIKIDGDMTEAWPADFMDEATDEESAIFYAKLEKEENPEKIIASVEMSDEIEPEIGTSP